jgi:hypothetical protein
MWVAVKGQISRPDFPTIDAFFPLPCLCSSCIYPIPDTNFYRHKCRSFLSPLDGKYTAPCFRSIYIPSLPLARPRNVGTKSQRLTPAAYSQGTLLMALFVSPLVEQVTI